MIPTHIIIHHSLTEDGKTVSWDAIRRYHMDPQGPYKMLDIGYHYGIELINDRLEILVGRMMTDVGAHCRQGGMNSHSLGIMLCGNFDLRPPGDARIELLLRFVKSLQLTWKIGNDRVKRHTDYAPEKSCPGKLFPWEQFKTLLEK